jgi:hypothetical protein
VSYINSLETFYQLSFYRRMRKTHPGPFRGGSRDDGIERFPYPRLDENRCG